MFVKRYPFLVWSFSIALALSVFPSIGHSGEPIAKARQSELNNLIRQDCGSCHGMTLNGGLGSPLHSKNLTKFATDELTEIILEGIPGTPMPPWKYLLSKSEAYWIANSLKKGSVK